MNETTAMIDSLQMTATMTVGRVQIMYSMILLSFAIVFLVTLCNHQYVLAREQPVTTKPHILMIIVDDLGWAGCGNICPDDGNACRTFTGRNCQKTHTKGKTTNSRG